MRYWDSSSIVPLLAVEAGSDVRVGQLKQDGRVTTWWATRVECTSALHRLRREQVLDDAALSDALKALDQLLETSVEVEPTQEIRGRAIRLLRNHALRAADALQLAAALAACRETPESLPFVTNDSRLKAAAEREGFSVL